MRSIKMVALAVVLALGSGGVGFALARRPRPHGPTPTATVTECAVPVAPAPSEPEVLPPREEAREVAHEEASEIGEERRGPSEVRARRLVVTHAIEAREPVDDLEVVERAPGERLYAFVDLANPGTASEVEVTFRHESGLTVGRVMLEVPAGVSRHRTWAYSTHVAEPGHWTAVVRDAEGRTLSSQSFEVR